MGKVDKSPSETDKSVKSGKDANALSQILNGEFLTKSFVLNNLPYIFFILLLLIVFVAKGYYVKQINDDIKIKSLTMEWMEKYSVREEFDCMNWSLSRCNNPEQLYHDVWNTVAKMIEQKEASTIFVAPQFSTTNAQAFKRIAVSINKALRKLSFYTGINIQISELYHPEFVSKQSGMSHMRRSPFPTLEIHFEM